MLRSLPGFVSFNSLFCGPVFRLPCSGKVSQLPEVLRHACSQPPVTTNRGNVTHCSQKMRAIASRGPFNGSGGVGS